MSPSVSRTVATLLTVSMLAACSDGRTGPGLLHGGDTVNKEDVGTAVGAIGGGVLGSAIGGGTGQVIAIIGGTLLGGFLGNAIGASLDNADRAAYDQASQRAMESGTRQTWRNADSGHHGSIRPGKRYTNSDGDTCRKYTQTIYVDGKAHTAHGVACREEDGSWQISD